MEIIKTQSLLVVDDMEKYRNLNKRRIENSR